METSDLKVMKFNDGMLRQASDDIVREESLEISVNGEKKYFCMRMPGMDYELAIGLLYNEGIIDSLTDIEKSEISDNLISLNISGKAHPGVRKIYSSSGSMFSDDLVTPPVQMEGTIQPGMIFSLQNKFFSMQKIFIKTGGVHACAFFSSEGELISFAEDVGRHNALDKCMGKALASGMEKNIFIIMLTSRISFEMIRKSFRTGAVIVAGVSAATSAAINAADQSGITLIGFLRGEKFNVYAHPERIN